MNKQIKLMAEVIAFMKSFDDARHVLNSVIGACCYDLSAWQIPCVADCADFFNSS